MERGGPGGPVAGALFATDRPPGEGGSVQAQLARSVLGEPERGVAPDERFFGETGLGVGEDGQDHGLRVPERMPVVARPGEAFCADRALLRAGARLQGLEEAEADGLLQVRVTVDRDVGPRPELAQVVLLALLQSVEALHDRALQAAVHLVSQPFHRLLRGPVVGEELDEAERAAGGQRHRDGEPTEIRLTLHQWVDVRPALDDVVHPGRHRKTARLRGVHQDDAGVVVGVEAAFEHGAESRRAPRVDRRHHVAPVGDEAGLQRHAHGRVQRLHLVTDRRDAAIAERDEAPAGHADGAAADGLPEEVPLEDPGAQVEDPLMLLEAPPVDVQRLVLDQQPYRRAVRDADDRLTGLGEPERPLGVGDRIRLEEAAQVRAAEGGRLALVQRPTDPDVAVREREDRLALRQQAEIEPLLADRPLLHPEEITWGHLRPPCCLDTAVTVPG